MGIEFMRTRTTWCFCVLLLATGLACDRGQQREADSKLRAGAQDFQKAGKQAAVKLDRAALVAKVKAALVNDEGLKTVHTIEVTADGQVITLRGTVSSEDRKREAEQTAARVTGVSSVVNRLEVR